jgi:cyanophycinase
MTGTLALVGGSEWTEGCTFDVDLLADSGGDEVLVLLTAAAFENPAKVGARAAERFGAIGARVVPLMVLRRPDALAAEVVERVAAARFIYVAGGSPMHLRSVLLNTPLWDAIVSAWSQGSVLACSGEGATALSTHMVDPRGGAFTVGLDLFDRLTVIPRYNRMSEDNWHRTVKLAPRGMAVVGIDEATALISDGDDWRTDGVGSVTAYRDGTRIELADLPSLAELLAVPTP